MVTSLTSYIRNYFPYFLPLLLIFSRSLADITIVLVSIFFLYYSYKSIGWEWIKERWFCFALIFSAYCMTINSVLSINPTESLVYSIFFIRWPIFAMALAFWVLNDIKSLKRFLLSMTIVLVFTIFDTYFGSIPYAHPSWWWPYVHDLVCNLIVYSSNHPALLLLHVMYMVWKFDLFWCIYCKVEHWSHD